MWYVLKLGVSTVCLLLVSNTALFAQKFSRVREYTYRASDVDSKSSARTNASAELRAEFLREVGAYIYSQQKISATENSYSYDDITIAISAGVVKMKMLDEKWDGKDYWIKAEMTVDLDEINKELKRLQDAVKLPPPRKDPPQPKVLPGSKTPEPDPFITRGHNNYLAWGYLSAGYPWMFGMSIVGRHGGIVGVGYYGSFGFDIGGKPVRDQDLDVGPLHYAVGIKFFPYKSIFVSAGYGTLGAEKMGGFNYDDGRWGTIGWRQGTGVSMMVGYDVFITESNGLFLSLGAGASYDFFMRDWRPAVSLKLGGWWKL